MTCRAHDCALDLYFFNYCAIIIIVSPARVVKLKGGKDMQSVEARVIENIRYFVSLKRSEIWVLREQLKTAEIEFQRLKTNGTITSATFRPGWSCNGSANFLVEYPD